MLYNRNGLSLYVLDRITFLIMVLYFRFLLVILHLLQYRI